MLLLRSPALLSVAMVTTVDGSRGEGGGQVLRNAISYAAILSKKIEVQNIRANRAKPGLAAQHCTGLGLARDICGGFLEGNELRSRQIRYTPDGKNREDQTRTVIGDTGTAGSICLLLQAALPCALFGTVSPCCLILKGGTNAALAPQYDYWDHVFWPTVQGRFGLPADLVKSTVVCRGYFPRGGGEVQIHTQPLKTPMLPIVLTDRGEVCELYIRSHVAGKLPRYMAEEMVKGAETVLRDDYPSSTIPRKIEIVMERNAVGSGSGVLIVAKTSTGCLLGGSALGRPKTQARAVGLEAATELTNALKEGGCVDDWLQDQLILFMALANGTSEILTGALTLHTQTAIWVAEQLCGAKFTVTNLSTPQDAKTNLGGKDDEETSSYGMKGRVPGKHLIRCEGVGFVNRP